MAASTHLGRGSTGGDSRYLGSKVISTTSRPLPDDLVLEIDDLLLEEVDRFARFDFVELLLVFE